MEIRNEERKERIHGEQERSKKGKGTLRTGVELGRKEEKESSVLYKETWRAGME
jgi:hypothetical protein